MKRPYTYLNSRRTKIFRGILACYCLILVFKFVKKCIPVSDDYTTWAISDWMINFQGGFVRRGITGELLLQLYEMHPYPLREAIMIVAGLAFVAFVWMLARLFNKEGWSHLLLFAPCLLVMTVPMKGWFWTRRDNMALLITWAIFLLYSRYAHKRSQWGLVAMQLLSALSLLIHEASFFFTFPLLFLHAYGQYAQPHGNPIRPITKTLLLLSPALAAMAAVCLFKGDAATAQAIWNSWMPCMELYPTGSDPDIIGKGVAALAWDTLPTFEFHFRQNWMRLSGSGIPYFPFTLLKFAALYYLVTRINTVDLKWNTLKPIDRISMSNIMLAQLCFLLPLFTVLSCDMPRIFGYWVFSTLLAYHFFRHDNILFHGWLSRISRRLQSGMDNAMILSSPWTYITVLLCL